MHYQKIRYFGMALLACGFLLGQRNVSAQKAVITRTSYEIDSHGTIYLTARLNDKDEARFMLDTGSRTFLSDKLVTRLSLKSRPFKGADGKEVKFQNGDPVQVAAAKIALPNTPIVFSGDVMILPDVIIKNMAMECEGIIGIDTLSRFSLFLNPNSRQLAIMQGGVLNAETLHRFGMDAIKPVPLTVDAQGFYQIPIEVPGVAKTTILLDTGSEFTKFPPDLAHKVSKDWKSGGVISTATGSFPIYTTYLDRLKVGEAEVHRQRVVYSEQPSGPVLPLGRDFLSRFEILLDFPAKKAYLKPLMTTVGITPFAQRRLGVEDVLQDHIITFTYGGKMTGPNTEEAYQPGFSALISAQWDITLYTITKNAPPADAYSKPVEIPFDLESGAILVTATIDKKPVRMVLDTGSACSWLTTQVGNRLGMTQGSTIKIGQAQALQTVFNSLSLSTTAPDFLAYCVGYVADKPFFYRLTDLPLPAQAEGVLGLDYLSNQVFGLDMAHHKLIAWPIASTTADRMRWLTNSSEAPKADVVTIPLTHEADDWFYASASIGEQNLKLVVDTAYPGAGRLPASADDAEYGLTLQPAVGAAQKGAPSAAALPGQNGMLKALRLGDLTLEALPVQYVPSQDVQSLPLLGMDAFKGRRVLFDLPGKTIYVSRKTLP